jgi:hypothetical protein
MIKGFFTLVLQMDGDTASSKKSPPGDIPPAGAKLTTNAND